MVKKKRSTSTKRRLKTLAVKQESKKDKILKELERCPIIEVACVRTGVGRSTYYEWIHKDKKFSQRADKALSIGNAIFTDLAESKLMENIQRNNSACIIFRLKNFHNGYAERRHLEIDLPPRELDLDEDRKVSNALRHMGLEGLLGISKRKFDLLVKKIGEEEKKLAKESPSQSRKPRVMANGEEPKDEKPATEEVIANPREFIDNIIRKEREEKRRLQKGY